MLLQQCCILPESKLSKPQAELAYTITMHIHALPHTSCADLTIPTQYLTACIQDVPCMLSICLHPATAPLHPRPHRYGSHQDCLVALLAGPPTCQQRCPASPCPACATGLMPGL